MTSVLPISPFTEGISKLLSTTGHELRTPLNGIIGALELINDTPLTPEQAHYLDLIRACAGEIVGLADRLGKANDAIGRCPPPGEASPIPDLSDLPILNPEQLDILRSEGLLERLTGLFRETAEKAIRDMEVAFGSENGRALSSGAHLLKGSAANFGAERLVAICQALEQSATEQPQNILSQLMTALHEEYALAIQELDVA